METQPTLGTFEQISDHMLAMAVNTDVPVTIRKKCLAVVENLNAIEAYHRRQALQPARDALPKKGTSDVK